MDVVIVVIFVAFFLSLWVAMISAIVSAARTAPEHWQRVGRSKGVTIALIVFTGGFGGYYYWWRIRPGLRTAASRPTSGLHPESGGGRARTR